MSGDFDLDRDFVLVFVLVLVTHVVVVTDVVVVLDEGFFFLLFFLELEDCFLLAMFSFPGRNSAKSLVCNGPGLLFHQTEITVGRWTHGKGINKCFRLPLCFRSPACPAP